MTLWRIKRMEPVPELQATIDCSDGEEARQITLVDTDTNEVDIVQMCYRLTENVCYNLNNLGVTYTPNDWDAECNP